MTKAIKTKLLANGASKVEMDHKPVVKFFDPTGSATWWISEMMADEDTLFGLCDLGFGCPELGNVSLKELATTKVRFNLNIERDLHFVGNKPLSEYLFDLESKNKAYASQSMEA